VAYNTLFKAGRVVWCEAVGYASVLRDVARRIAYSPTPDHTASFKQSVMCHML